MVSVPSKWHYVTMAIAHNPMGGGFLQATSHVDAKEKFAKKYSPPGKEADFLSFVVSDYPFVPGVRYRDCMMTTTEIGDLFDIRCKDEERYLRIIKGEEDRLLPGWYNCTIQDQTKQPEPYLGCCFLYADSHYQARETCKELHRFAEPAFVLASHGDTKVAPKYQDRLIGLQEYTRMNSYLALHGMKAFFHMLETGEGL